MTMTLRGLFEIIKQITKKYRIEITKKALPQIQNNSVKIKIFEYFGKIRLV